MKNQKCLLEVTFIDLENVTQTAIIEHNGDTDCWYGIVIEDEKGEKAFDFNTFTEDCYLKDKQKELYVSAYQCMNKENDVWTMNNSQQIEVISFKKVSKSKKVIE